MHVSRLQRTAGSHALLEKLEESAHKGKEAVSRTEDLRAWGQCLTTAPLWFVHLHV